MAVLPLPTKFLIVGVLLAAAVSAVGYGVTTFKLAHVDTLITQCQTEHKRVPVSKAEPWRSDPLVCDPNDLRRTMLHSSLVGVQAQIVKGHSAASTWFERSLYLAGVLLVLFAVPYAWYFLLRRIREFGDAVSGK